MSVYNFDAVAMRTSSGHRQDIVSLSSCLEVDVAIHVCQRICAIMADVWQVCGREKWVLSLWHNICLFSCDVLGVRPNER